MRPKRAIVRVPGAKYTDCISSHPLRHTINIELAREQHARYCGSLSELGLEVIQLPRDDAYPDSCFVEDNAVVQSGKALICRMAKESRRGEETEVERALSELVRTKRAAAPATIEGGDVVHLDRGLISGETQRTNKDGIAQLREWLGVEVKTIADPRIIHLKSYVNYMGKGIMISTSAYANHPALRAFKVIVVPDDQWYAANNLVVGDTVLMPDGFPETKSLIEQAGFHVIPLDMTEFPKCEGALTCLSILV